MRAALHPIHLTGLAPDEPDALVLCPEICWAGELVGGDAVEIYHLPTRRRFLAPVRHGGFGQARIHGGAARHCRVGDTVIVTACGKPASASGPALPGWRVRLGEVNNAIEIRRLCREGTPPAGR